MATAEQLKAEIWRYIEGKVHVEDLDAWLFETGKSTHDPEPAFDALAARLDLAIQQHWLNPSSMPDEKLRQHLATLIDGTA